MIGKKASDVLSYVQQFLPEAPVVVEAGAFKGHDTLTISTFWPNGKVYAFEPIPSLYHELTARVNNVSNVTCYPYALGNQSGTVMLYIAQRPNKPGIITQASSALAPTLRLEKSPFIYPETLEVSSVTLNDWAEKTGVANIDFLWLDVQGYELEVLKHASLLLPKVKVIYCEVHFIKAYEGQPLYQEIREWLELQGFVAVAKDFVDEHAWFFGNVVFVHKSPL